MDQTNILQTMMLLQKLIYIFKNKRDMIFSQEVFCSICQRPSTLWKVRSAPVQVLICRRKPSLKIKFTIINDKQDRAFLNLYFQTLVNSMLLCFFQILINIFYLVFWETGHAFVSHFQHILSRSFIWARAVFYKEI